MKGVNPSHLFCAHDFDQVYDEADESNKNTGSPHKVNSLDRIFNFISALELYNE